MHDDRGQATTEYAALLALVTLALVGAGAAVGLDAIAKAVEHGVRTGVCIVGGDICRASDAAAAGLSPCTVTEETKGAGAIVTVAWVRIGKAGDVTVATRSDGTVLVTKIDEKRGGAGTGIGIDASPLGIDIGAEVSADLTIASGRAWEFPDMAAARRYLEGGADPGPPVWRFGQAGDVLTAEANARLGFVTWGGVEALSRGAVGARVSPAGTTLYMRVNVGAGIKSWTPQHGTHAEGPTTGDAIVEVTFDGTTPREIAFRRVGRPAGEERVVDTVARLDLRDPVNRRAAEALFARAVTWREPEAIDQIRSMLALAVQRGTVERSVYEVHDDSGRFELAAQLGAELGVDVSRVQVQRRLVSASAWTGGSQERLREDCTSDPSGLAVGVLRPR